MHLFENFTVASENVSCIYFCKLALEDVGFKGINISALKIILTSSDVVYVLVRCQRLWIVKVLTEAVDDNELLMCVCFIG